MITKRHIKEGIEKGIVRFEIDPNAEHGTVCAIGDYWFYFGGLTAEELNPEEYVAITDEDEVVQSVFEVLEDFRTIEDYKDEYAYYLAILFEGGVIK